jgi:hypothetical protein
VKIGNDGMKAMRQKRPKHEKEVRVQHTTSRPRIFLNNLKRACNSVAALHSSPSCLLICRSSRYAGLEELHPVLATVDIA